MTRAAQLLCGNNVETPNSSVPVRLGEILPEVMADIRLRMDENAKCRKFSAPKQDC
jgi:hypothetical protein